MPQPTLSVEELQAIQELALWHELDHDDIGRMAKMVLAALKRENEDHLIQFLVSDTVECKLCGKQVPALTAHPHQQDWIGEDCCWDDRLRITA